MVFLINLASALAFQFVLEPVNCSAAYYCANNCVADFPTSTFSSIYTCSSSIPIVDTKVYTLNSYLGYVYAPGNVTSSAYEWCFTNTQETPPCVPLCGAQANSGIATLCQEEPGVAARVLLCVQPSSLSGCTSTGVSADGVISAVYAGLDLDNTGWTDFQTFKYYLLYAFAALVACLVGLLTTVAVGCAARHSKNPLKYCLLRSTGYGFVLAVLGFVGTAIGLVFYYLGAEKMVPVLTVFSESFAISLAVDIPLVVLKYVVMARRQWRRDYDFLVAQRYAEKKKNAESDASRPDASKGDADKSKANKSGAAGGKLAVGGGKRALRESSSISDSTPHP